jgi:hypothetical protein
MMGVGYHIRKRVSEPGRVEFWSSEGLGQSDGYETRASAVRAVKSLQVLANRDPSWAGVYQVRDPGGDSVATIVLTSRKKAAPKRTQATRRAGNWEGDDDRDGQDDFDLQGELRTGMIIGDERGGYSVSLEGKYLGSFKSFDKALIFAEQHMHDHSYWPNVFYVNERGNTDLLAPKPKVVKGKVIKVPYKTIRSWV